MNKEKKSKKLIKKRRKEIYEDIKNGFKDNKELIKPEPILVLIFGWSYFGLAILSVIVEVISLKFNHYFLFCITVLFLLIISIANIILDRKYKLFHEKKASDMRDLCAMVLDDEAKKYGTTKEVLSLYLTKKYENPFIIKLLIIIIPILCTAFAVRFLPGFDIREGVVFFIVLVLANAIISWGGDKVCDELKFSNYWDFYLVDPYKDEFDKIENKLKSEKE